LRLYAGNNAVYELGNPEVGPLKRAADTLIAACEAHAVELFAAANDMVRSVVRASHKA
jgi:hypothetical protein